MGLAVSRDPGILTSAGGFKARIMPGLDCNENGLAEYCKPIEVSVPKSEGNLKAEELRYTAESRVGCGF